MIFLNIFFFRQIGQIFALYFCWVDTGGGGLGLIRAIMGLLNIFYFKLILMGIINIRRNWNYINIKYKNENNIYKYL